jgi:hypothetical protein
VNIILFFILGAGLALALFPKEGAIAAKIAREKAGYTRRVGKQRSVPRFPWSRDPALTRKRGLFLIVVSVVGLALR